MNLATHPNFSLTLDLLLGFNIEVKSFFDLVGCGRRTMILLSDEILVAFVVLLARYAVHTSSIFSGRCGRDTHKDHLLVVIQKARVKMAVSNVFPLLHINLIDSNLLDH